MFESGMGVWAFAPGVGRPMSTVLITACNVLQSHMLQVSAQANKLAGSTVCDAQAAQPHGGGLEGGAEDLGAELGPILDALSSETGPSRRK
jgi:hypothetical protein